MCPYTKCLVEIFVITKLDTDLVVQVQLTSSARSEIDAAVKEVGEQEWLSDLRHISVWHNGEYYKSAMSTEAYPTTLWSIIGNKDLLAAVGEGKIMQQVAKWSGDKDLFKAIEDSAKWGSVYPKYDLAKYRAWGIYVGLHGNEMFRMHPTEGVLEKEPLTYVYQGDAKGKTAVNPQIENGTQDVTLKSGKE